MTPLLLQGPWCWCIITILLSPPELLDLVVDPLAFVVRKVHCARLVYYHHPASALF